MRAGGEEQSTTRFAPCAYHSGQAGNGAHHHPAVGVAGNTVAQTDSGWALRGVGDGEALDVPCRNARYLSHPVGGVFAQHPFAKRFPANGVVAQKLLVMQPFTKDNVHHAQRERAVCPVFEVNVPIGAFGGTGTEGVYHDERCSLLLGVAQDRHLVRTGAGRVHPPYDDGFGIYQPFRVNPPRPAHCVAVASLGSRGAYRA
ncbi:hypothetical protein HRbin16_02595 [bacterium HR16]|nr:hypothetical protein HRbin16_02595 [bacterium HR16]